VAADDAGAADRAESPGRAAFPIVGVGASAGGLEALEKLFGAMPAESGMAFVVIQHLDPTRQSHMVELLSHRTRMSVVAVEEGAKVQADRVYMILPNSEVTIEDGILHLAEPSESRAARRPVDTFLISLAEDQKECSVGVILSGTGSNGSSGIRAIKEYGGLALAQAPETAAHPGMPRSAIATGMIDAVLPPDQIAEVLVRYARHLHLELRPEQATEPAGDDASTFTNILAFVQARTGHDFRFYKKATLTRRMHRRVGLHGFARLADYERFLRHNPQEVQALVKDLTITVSGFFRDPEAWEALNEQVIAPLVRERPGGEVIRVWVPACASGEEAYTIAMLIAEQAEAAQKSFDVKIFATDPAEDGLSMARRGLFPGTIERDVSDERLRRFFERTDDSFLVRKELREWVIFAPQNLLQDPPFFRVDLVSCRNFLIYLEEEAQSKVIALFHFALNDNGSLLLGAAETLGRSHELFETVSKKWRIYRRLGPTRHDIVDFPIAGRRMQPAGGGIQAAAEQLFTAHTADIAQRALASRFAPASVMIDRAHRIVYFHGATEDYLANPPGQPTRDLFAMVRDGLRTKLRGAVQMAARESRPVTIPASVRSGGSGRPVTVTVSPVRGQRADGMLLVSFEGNSREPAVSPAAPASEPVQSDALSTDDARIEREFETELNNVRDELSRTIEELEASNEELKASNEEITSMNEELQSANEELETSKEELQSLNEELNTVNNELQTKVEELEGTTNDLSNLLSSTEIATVFLDQQLKIRFFTPSMSSLMDVIASDIGRPIGSFAPKFKDPNLLQDAQGVLARLVPAEAEVPADNGRWYQRRVIPYRTQDNRIDGIVVTFADITTPKQAEAEVRAAHDQIAQIYDSVPHPLVVLDPELQVRSANEAFYRLFQVRRDDTVGRPIHELGNRQWDVQTLRQLLVDVLSKRQAVEDYVVEHEFEHLGPRVMLLQAAQVRGAQLILLSIQDITERKHWEEHQQLLVSELSHRVKNTLATVQSIAAQTIRHAASLESFYQDFSGRLQALGGAHALLTARNWQSLDLRSVVVEPLRAYTEAGERVRLQGPEIELKPGAALALSLAVHELATNAAKHGALSKPEGAIVVDWNLTGSEDRRVLRLVWSEHDGPKVAAPAEHGFGLGLIERLTSYELDGDVRYDFTPEGFACELRLPYNADNFRGVADRRAEDAARTA
jgi:two-component system CheB/CheR fusion protein